MRKISLVVSVIALLLVITPACLYLVGEIDKPLMKYLMLGGTVLWFASSPMWIGRGTS